LLTAYSRTLNLSSSDTFDKSRKSNQGTKSTRKVLSSCQRI